jgi:outer membrane protein assembly factor BamE (lipoprotein component of BamABCDE complex)
VPPTPAPTARKPPAGRIADEETLRGLVQGKTTQAEVRELFGVPREVIMNPAGESFIYYQDRTSGFFTRTTERIESLTVRFDVKGVLKDFEYRYAGK